MGNAGFKFGWIWLLERDRADGRRMNGRPFVIWSLGFNASVGGSIVLHYLCHLINSLGHEAYIWPGARFPGYNVRFISDVRSIEIAQRLIRFAKSKINRDTFYLHAKLKTPIASHDILKDAIVVYPEIVDGNPLNCERAVRWFLYHPRACKRSPNYGSSDLFFYYQEYFNDSNINKNKDNLLRIRWLRDDLYKQSNFGTRSGSCYLIRKGAERSDVVRPKNSKRIDHLGHKRVAKIFNQTEQFFSYDIYTMYCVYAAMCGCIPVVVPRAGLSLEDWRSNPQDRYGIAYGTSQIDWAVETRPLLIDRVYKEKAQEREMVESFINKALSYFD